MTQGRRESDRRIRQERRRENRRHGGRVCTASWEDQRVQYVTRYMFWALYLLYFRLGGPIVHAGPERTAVVIAGGVYFILTTAYLLHARRYIRSVVRWRLAMWTDLLMVSFAVMMDPNPMSPAYLAYIMVILGNGMRYGMRLFAETLIGTFSFVAIITVLRFSSYLHVVSATTLFFLAFFAIIIVYAYSLMSRIEKSRLQLEVESNVDLLTGLLNRRGLQERADTLFRELTGTGRQAAVLFADMDRFKSINDELGHHAGDRVLKEIGGIIRAAVREYDVAARYGGDEFVIVMPDTDVDNAAGVARRLQEAVARWSQEDHISLSMSVGIGVAPQDGHDLASVLRRVDSAMYQGKLADGRGGIRCAGQQPDPA